MGNNQAFTTLEKTIISLYDKGVLDEDVLVALMEAHRGTDIDEGGMHGITSSDGLDVHQVVLKTLKEPLTGDYWDRFSDLCYERFGWR